MSLILEVEDLYKTYKKSPRPALDGLSFSVSEGAIYAFVGPNGAGKTTTIRILATLLKLDSGIVRIGGYQLDTHLRDVRRMLGYIPDEFGLYDEMPVTQYLDFFAGCYGIDRARRPQIVADLLDLVGLSHRAMDDVKSLSRGMRQRLGLARALVHDPMLIVADEPASGLDPRARVELRDIFRALQEMGKTIFLSSHVLRELDEVATHVGIIEAGKLVASGPIEEISEHLLPHRNVRITFLETYDDALAWLHHRTDVINIEPVNGSRTHDPTLLVSLQGDRQQVARLLAELVNAGFPVLSFVEEQQTLESMFLSLTQGVVS